MPSVSLRKRRAPGACGQRCGARPLPAAGACPSPSGPPGAASGIPAGSRKPTRALSLSPLSPPPPPSPWSPPSPRPEPPGGGAGTRWVRSAPGPAAPEAMSPCPRHHRPQHQEVPAPGCVEGGGWGALPTRVTAPRGLPVPPPPARCHLPLAVPIPKGPAGFMSHGTGMLPGMRGVLPAPLCQKPPDHPGCSAGLGAAWPRRNSPPPSPTPEAPGSGGDFPPAWGHLGSGGGTRVAVEGLGSAPGMSSPGGTRVENKWPHVTVTGTIPA